MDKAKEIVEQAKQFTPSNGNYTLKSNSLKGAAVVLAMDAKELMERLNAPRPTKLLNDLAEARNRIRALTIAGNNLALNSTESLSNEWVKATRL